MREVFQRHSHVLTHMLSRSACNCNESDTRLVIMLTRLKVRGAIERITFTSSVLLTKASRVNVIEIAQHVKKIIEITGQERHAFTSFREVVTFGNVNDGEHAIKIT